MSTDNLRELFNLLNLSTEAIKIYLELLRNREYSPLELSKKLKIPRTKVYRVLTKLTEVELIQEIKSKKETKRFQAKDPQAILQLIHRKERKLLIMKSSSITVVNQLKELFDLNRQDEFHTAVDLDLVTKTINSTKDGFVQILLLDKSLVELANNIQIEPERFSLVLRNKFSNLNTISNIRLLSDKTEFEENVVLIEEDHIAFIIKEGFVHRIKSRVVFDSLKLLIESLR